MDGMEPDGWVSAGGGSMQGFSTACKAECATFREIRSQIRQIGQIGRSFKPKPRALIANKPRPAGGSTVVGVALMQGIPEGALALPGGGRGLKRLLALATFAFDPRGKLC